MTILIALLITVNLSVSHALLELVSSPAPFFCIHIHKWLCLASSQNMLLLLFFWLQLLVNCVFSQFEFVVFICAKWMLANTTKTRRKRVAATDRVEMDAHTHTHTRHINSKIVHFSALLQWMVYPVFSVLFVERTDYYLFWVHTLSGQKEATSIPFGRQGISRSTSSLSVLFNSRVASHLGVYLLIVYSYLAVQWCIRIMHTHTYRQQSNRHTRQTHIHKPIPVSA